MCVLTISRTKVQMQEVKDAPSKKTRGKKPPGASIRGGELERFTLVGMTNAALLGTTEREGEKKESALESCRFYIRKEAGPLRC